MRVAALILGAYVAGTIFGPAVVSAANSAITNVLVTNTTANPVPVSGNVTVSGTPTVAVGNFPTTQVVSGSVGITGTPTVGLAAGSTVRVAATTVVIAQGETSVPHTGLFDSLAIANDVSAYREVTLYLRIDGITPGSQICLASLSGTVDGFAIGTFDAPTTLGLAVVKTYDPAPPTIGFSCTNMSTSTADYTWLLVGRTN